MLVVTLRFPPHGGGGVQRTGYFVRYLWEEGWQLHVLTGPAEGRHVLDPTLNDLIPPEVPVTRTRIIKGEDLNRAMGRLHLARVFQSLTPSLPNMSAGWAPFAVPAGVEILGSGGFDLIYSSAYPVGSHLVAYLLKRRTGLPWIADYRDEWSIRPVVSWPTPIHRRLARLLDRTFVSAADRVVTTSPAHTESFSRAFGHASKFETITNGFDPVDFQGPLSRPEGAGGGERFLVCHVGTVFSWRGPGTLLSAVAGLVERGLVPAHRIQVQFVGFGVPSGHEGLERSGILRVSGYVNHADAVAWMRAADLLVLLNRERANIPGKTFEYLASRTPILALCPPSQTAEMVRGQGAGLVIDPDDEDGIAHAIQGAYERWEAGKPALDTAGSDLTAFERPVLAGRLGDLFEQVLADRRPTEPVG